MPTYNYYCKDCKKNFSYFQRINDDILKTCHNCSGTLERVITGGMGLIFKGQGFYQTDYKEKKEKKVDSPQIKTSKKENKNKSISKKENTNE
tara:strand:- start:1246 stop:1521 length:276 start_codon:yes stop_codon:yes gene_type:complete